VTELPRIKNNFNLKNFFGKTLKCKKGIKFSFQKQIFANFIKPHLYEKEFLIII